jgi:hypothetical protein
MKEVFFDLRNLVEHKNVSIAYHSFTKSNLLLNIKNYGTFATVLRHPKTKQVQLYYSNWLSKNFYNHDSNLTLLTSDDGVHFKNHKVVYKGNMIATFNCVFYDDNVDQYRMIGGNHMMNYSKFKQYCKAKTANHSMKCLKGTKPKVVRLSKKRSITVLSDETPNRCKLNGLYLYSSGEDHVWKANSSLPMRLSFTNKSIDFRFNQYDSQPSCVYRMGNYCLFTRVNVTRMVRSVQLHTSPDLKTWSLSKELRFHPPLDRKHDNHYIFKVKRIEGTDNYVGFSSYFHTKSGKNGIAMYYSTNMLDWYYVYMLINYKPRVLGHPRVNTLEGCPITSNDGKEYYIYTVFNNMIYQYFYRVDGFTSVQAKETEGSFLIQLDEPTATFTINHQTQGYVKAELLDENKKVIPGFEKEKSVCQSGDHVFGELRWPESAPSTFKITYLQIYLQNSNIYSIRSS